jgi:hypothetical protein
MLSLLSDENFNDTNIVLDFLLQREPFLHDAELLF